MDIKLEKALEFSNYIATFESQKRILFERYQQNLILYKNGGKFAVTEHRLNFLQTLLSNGVGESVLIDDNNLPVRFENLEELFKEMLETFNEATGRYEYEYNALKSKRSIEKLVDLNE